MEYNIKMKLKELGEEGLYWIRVAQAGCCEGGSGIFGSTKRRGFLDQLRNMGLLS